MSDVLARIVWSEIPLYIDNDKALREFAKAKVSYDKASEKLGMLAGISAVSEDDDVMAITDTGIIIRTRVSEISVYSRTAAGVRVMRIGEDMKIVSFTRVDRQEEQPEGEEGTDGAESTEGAVQVSEAVTEDSANESGSDGAQE